MKIKQGGASNLQISLKTDEKLNQRKNLTYTVFIYFLKLSCVKLLYKNSYVKVTGCLCMYLSVVQDIARPMKFSFQ